MKEQEKQKEADKDLTVCKEDKDKEISEIVEQLEQTKVTAENKEEL